MASSPQQNPYASPQSAAADSSEPVDWTDAHAVRSHYLRYESAVRQMGWWFYCLALGLVGSLISFIATWNAIAQTSNIFAQRLAITIATGGLLYGSLAAACLVMGGKLRRLKPSGRWWLAIGAVSGLLCLPGGPFIGMYGLYLALSRHRKVVFSERYQRVVQQTPDVRPSRLVVLDLLMAISLVAWLAMTALQFVGRAV